MNDRLPTTITKSIVKSATGRSDAISMRPDRLMLVTVLAALGIFPWVADNYTLHLAILSGIAVIAASSLNLILGYAGRLSLGHAAFFGIGAYTSAQFTMALGLPVWIGMLAAGPAAALAALMIGPIVLWLRGAYFIIVTLSFSIVLQLVFTNWIDLTNGPMGILGIPYPSLGQFEFSSKQSYFYLVAVSAIATLWLIKRLVHSRAGRAFEALRENELVAMSVGISKLYYSLIAFTIAAALAGFAGALYAHYVGVITPDLLGFDVMVSMLVMVIVGGKGTLVGPLIGAIIVTFVPEELRLLKEFRLSLFGVALMLSVLLAPNGIASLLPKVTASLLRWRDQR